MRRILARLEELWAESIDPADDLVYRTLLDALASGRDSATGGPTRTRGVFQKGQRMASLLASARFSFGRSAVVNVPRNAVYVNVGQYTPVVPQCLAWLDKRRDVKPVFMLHDVIPLENPECVSRTDLRAHRNIVRSIARYGAGLIVTTAHARETVSKALAGEGRPTIRTLSISLPLAEAFDLAPQPEPLLESIPYFVVCGAIEPRKNHLFLLKVWQTLCQSLESAPHLVIVGSPWWRGRSILDQISSCAATRGKIHHAAGLSTAALKPLVAGSLGLLTPSLTEGFGLPIVEALHLGTPVVASDIPAHREVVGDRGVLVDPNDVEAWRSAICALIFDPGRRPTARPATEAGRERFELSPRSASFSKRCERNFHAGRPASRFAGRNAWSAC